MVIHFHDKKINLKNLLFVEDCFLVLNSQTVPVKCEAGYEQQVVNQLPDWVRNNYEVVRQTGWVMIMFGLNL